MKSMKKLFLLLGSTVLAGGLTGCDLFKKEEVHPSITIACDTEERQIERKQTVQFSVDLKAINASDVVYNVSSEVASIDTTGKLVVSETAAVGATFTVSASAGEVVSNEISFEVKDTLPTQIRVTPSQTSIKVGDEISFDAKFYPEYSTLVEYNLEVVENDEIAEVVDKKLKLKDGVDFVSHLGDQIKVRASLSADANIKHEVVIAVGDTRGSLLVSNADIIARKQDTLTVNAVVYDENGKRVSEPSLPFIYDSSDETIFTVSDAGVITAKGHGTAVLTVKYGELETTATINVIVSPQSISVDGINSVISNGYYRYAKGSEYTLNITETKEEKWTKVSQEYTYDLKLFDKANGNLLSDKDEEIATIDENKFTFLKEGFVQVDILSNSSLNDVEVPTDKECTTSIKFDINAGKNVSNYAELRAALADETCADVNFVNSLMLKTEELLKDGNGLYYGNRSNGNKTLNGNGYEINFANVDLNNTNVTNSSLTGNNFIEFYPCASTSSDKNHNPFNVNIYDLSVIGNTDYNGLYNGNGTTAKGTPAWSSAGKYVGFYRSAFNIGTQNMRHNWVNQNGEVVNYDYWGSYVNAPHLNNVNVDGFYWGIWCHQVVDGYFNNIHTVNQAEKGILCEQSTLTLNNPSFDKNGSFCLELTQDGINNMTNVKAPDGVDSSLYLREPCSGANYNEPTKINMTGTIGVNNFSNGVDTTYLVGFSQELKAMGVDSINALIEAILLGTAQQIVKQIPVDASQLVSFARKIIFNNEGLINFFALSFMMDLQLSKYGENTTKYAVIQEEGNAAVTMTDLMIKEAMAIAQGGGHDVSYKNHKYIDFGLDTGAIAGNLGIAVICNNDYSPAN